MTVASGERKQSRSQPQFVIMLNPLQVRIHDFAHLKLSASRQIEQTVQVFNEHAKSISQ